MEKALPYQVAATRLPSVIRCKARLSTVNVSHAQVASPDGAVRAYAGPPTASATPVAPSRPKVPGQLPGVAYSTRPKAAVAARLPRPVTVRVHGLLSDGRRFGWLRPAQFGRSRWLRRCVCRPPAKNRPMRV